MDTKSFLYLKGGTYYECTLTIKEIEERINLGLVEGKFVAFPCILTINVPGGKNRSIRNYYIDVKEVMTYVDYLTDLTPEEFKDKPKEEKKEEVIKETVEKLEEQKKAKK